MLGGVPELRKIIAAAKDQKSYYGKKTILFVDEIHRFNKAQQDALLPHVENGTVTLVGATTENPSFAVNSALLSRTRVFDLKPLAPDELRTLCSTGLCGTKTDGVGHIAAAGRRRRASGDRRHTLEATRAAPYRLSSSQATSRNPQGSSE